MTEQTSIVTAPASNLPPVLKPPVTANGDSPNGSPSHAPARRARPRKSRLARRIIFGGLILSVLALAGFGYWLTTPSKAQRTDLILRPVSFEPLNLTVVDEYNAASP